MDELKALRAATSPREVLLVADGMTGQDAVRIARGFQEGVGLTGAILTKLDGDARGGAALSIHGVTGVRSEEHTSELQSQSNIVCRLLLEKKKNKRSLQTREILNRFYRCSNQPNCHAYRF